MTSKEIRKLIDKILNVTRHEIYEKKIFQGSDFERQDKLILENAFNLIKKVKKIDLSVFPDGYLDTIGNPIREYERLFETAKSINEEQEGSGPIRERERIVESIGKQYSKMFEAIRVVPIFFKDAEGISDEIQESFKLSLAELSTTLEANYFSDTAKKHERNANRWFFGSVGILAFLLLFVILDICPYDYKKDQTITWIHFWVARVFIISLCVYALNVCRTNFNNEKHNEVLNHQKHNSLRTFLGLLKATDEDKSSKDKIVHHACTLFFSKTATGFSKIQEIAPISLTEILKLIKQIFKK